MEKQEKRHERDALEDIAPRSAPFILYIDPCGACNFKCSFCPCNISGYRQSERHETMSWELFEKIVGDLRAFQGQIKVINLYAFGEPLLNPDIAAMVKKLKEEHCCREVRITTNGSLLTREMSRALVDAGLDLIRISVEALSTEGYQNLCGVNVRFSDIVENVRTFYELSRGTESKVSVKILSAELSSEADFRRFQDLFSPIADYYHVEDVSMSWPDFQEIRLPDGNPQTLSLSYQKGEVKSICSFPFTDMCIHSNGIVSACCQDWKFAVPYGNVKKTALSNIWNGAEHIRFQRAHLEKKLKENYPFCDSCLRKPPDIIKNGERILSNLERLSDGNSCE